MTEQTPDVLADAMWAMPWMPEDFDPSDAMLDAAALAMLSERFDPIQAAHIRDTKSPTWRDARREAQAALMPARA